MLPSHAPIVDRQDALRRWYSTAPGRATLAAVQVHLDRFLPELFGFHALQLGQVALAEDLLASSRINHRFCMEYRPSEGHVAALPEAWPVLADSLDLVVLMHTLELSGDPHQVMREVERTLLPEGHVIIVGFNPLSPVGFWEMLPGRRGSTPWAQPCYSTGRTREWLSLLGFEVRARAYAGFTPPGGGTGLRERLGIVRGLGGRNLPYLGGAYVILARKRVSTMTPMRRSWRPLRGMVPGGMAKPLCRRRDRE